MTPDTPPSQALIDNFVAAAHGDLARVTELLAQHPGLLNATASWGETAIEAAAQTAQTTIAEHLLAAGAPLGICTAAVLGRRETVERLLPEAPGGANATGAHGLSLLYHAVASGQREIAELLLAHGADVNAGAGRFTALHGAVLFNQPALAQRLLAHGADPRAKNRDGKTPRDLAAALQRDALLAVLSE